VNNRFRIPKDSDDWGNGKTYSDMRRSCPDPRLTADERNDPVELAAIEMGMNSWEAWEVYDGTYYDVDTYLHITPNTDGDGFVIEWSGNMPGCSRHEAIKALREFAMALLKVTSESPTGTNTKTLENGRWRRQP
jgi:hypothetical protein